MGWGAPNGSLAERARHMRRNPSEAEKRLWRALSNSQLRGLKFRRQHVIGRYIADFFCPAIGLIVEVDGDTHRRERDICRDRTMTDAGFTTVRFTNAEAMGNMEGVLLRIVEVAAALPPRRAWRLPHPNPSPEGEGLKAH
nr:DUF559 domain-containing protein [Sphingomonas aracearum]